MKVILIKYGELTTKGDNRKYFINVLYNNIKKALEGYNVNIVKNRVRMFIETDDDVMEIVNILKNIFGIHSIVIATRVNTNISEIEDNVLEVARENDFRTFKVETDRADKSFPIQSMDFSRRIGSLILRNIPNKKVLLENFDLEVCIEIRINEVLIYFGGIKGLGGYPVSTLGKGLLMLSGGIDSPVAGYLAMKRGIRLEAIYFDSPPHTSDMAREKVFDLARKLSIYNGSVKVHVINFTHIQEEIIKKIPNYYLITIMRRFMYEISALVANRCNAHVIINGESVGQVASQTLKSMEVINETIKKPVLRPVCCFDKLEIIDLAKKIGTYDISIRPYEDCCTIFVPKHPVIHPDLKLAKEYEKLIDKDELIYEAIKNQKIITLNNDDKDYSDLL